MLTQVARRGIPIPLGMADWRSTWSLVIGVSIGALLIGVVLGVLIVLAVMC